MRTFFQIGTNNGDDLFREKVISEKPDLVILVEPNPIHFEAIKENYQDIKGVTFYPNAIYYSDDEDIELFIPAIDGIEGNPGVNGITYSHGHYSLLPMNDWGDIKDMKKISAKSITFEKICQEHKITEIEFLQIDTEGFDSEIINMIDFSKYKIKKIRFEKWPFEPEKFTKHNKDSAHRLGKSGMEKTIKRLTDHGYEISEIEDADGNDIIAILSE